MGPFRRIGGANPPYDKEDYEEEYDEEDYEEYYERDDDERDDDEEDYEEGEQPLVIHIKDQLDKLNIKPSFFF